MYSKSTVNVQKTYSKGKSLYRKSVGQYDLCHTFDEVTAALTCPRMPAEPHNYRF